MGLDDKLDVESLLQEVQKREEAGNAEDNYLGYRALTRKGFDAVIKIEFDEKAKEAASEFVQEYEKLTPTAKKNTRMWGHLASTQQSFAKYFSAVEWWFDKHYNPRLFRDTFFKCPDLEHATTMALYHSLGDMILYAFSIDNQINVLLHSPEGGLDFHDKPLEEHEELRYNKNETTIALQYQFNRV